MKKIPVFLLFLIVTDGNSQKSQEKESLRPKLLNSDSSTGKLQKFTDSIMQAQQQTDPAEISNSVRNNADYFLQLQKEQKAKQKKAALMRIGTGVVFLIILIIGLRRKRVIRQ
jgi:hypothetical protein